MPAGEKKRRVMITAAIGALSGAILFAVLFLMNDPNPAYALFIPVAAAMGAGQAYLTD